MNTFANVMLLDEKTELYGNESILVQKLGRLILVADWAMGGVSVYVMNTSDFPVDAYNAQRLRDECLLGRKKFEVAFNIHDSDNGLSKESGVSFHKAMDGSMTIAFKNPLIDLDVPDAQVFNALNREMTKSLEFRKNACDATPDWLTRAITFVDMVKLNTPKAKAFLYFDTCNLMSPPKGFDLVVNIARAGFVVKSLPYFWDIYYDSSVTGIEYNPVFLKLPKRLLRPIRL